MYDALDSKGLVPEAVSNTPLMEGVFPLEGTSEWYTPVTAPHINPAALNPQE